MQPRRSAVRSGPARIRCAPARTTPASATTPIAGHQTQEPEVRVDNRRQELRDARELEAGGVVQHLRVDDAQPDLVVEGMDGGQRGGAEHGPTCGRSEQSPAVTDREPGDEPREREQQAHVVRGGCGKADSGQPGTVVTQGDGEREQTEHEQLTVRLVEPPQHRGREQQARDPQRASPRDDDERGGREDQVQREERVRVGQVQEPGHDLERRRREREGPEVGEILAAAANEVREVRRPVTKARHPRLHGPEVGVQLLELGGSHRGGAQVGELPRHRDVLAAVADPFGPTPRHQREPDDDEHERTDHNGSAPVSGAPVHGGPTARDLGRRLDGVVKRAQPGVRATTAYSPWVRRVSARSSWVPAGNIVVASA
jgi:hypothetical protein